MATEEGTVDCPRCGTTHTALLILLKKSFIKDGVYWMWWYMCNITNEPAFIGVERRNRLLAYLFWAVSKAFIQMPGKHHRPVRLRHSPP